VNLSAFGEIAYSGRYIDYVVDQLETDVF